MAEAVGRGGGRSVLEPLLSQLGLESPGAGAGGQASGSLVWLGPCSPRALPSWHPPCAVLPEETPSFVRSEESTHPLPRLIRPAQGCREGQAATQGRIRSHCLLPCSVLS